MRKKFFRRLEGNLILVMRLGDTYKEIGTTLGCSKNEVNHFSYLKEMIVMQFSTIRLAFFINCNFKQWEFKDRVENAVTHIAQILNLLIYMVIILMVT